MTLHWWMHWFWITLHLILCCNSIFPVETRPVDDLRTAKAINGTPNIPPKTLIPSNGNVTTATTFRNASTKASNINNNNTTIETTVIEPEDDFNQTMSPSTTGTNVESNQTNSINSTLFDGGEESPNVTSTALNVERTLEEQHNLSAASITGISLGTVAFVGLIVSGSVLLYRNRSFNRPQVLNDRCSNPDSSGYIDDSTIRENSEEMYSLDNDSFLNSLEAMTIQNYWTDTVKHTKL